MITIEHVYAFMHYNLYCKCILLSSIFSLSKIHNSADIYRLLMQFENDTAEITFNSHPQRFQSGAKTFSKIKANHDF